MNPRDAVVAAAGALGFVPDGQTRPETRWTRGGNCIIFGGRDRFRLPGTTVFATIGRLTTCVYHLRSPGGSPWFRSKLRTREVDRDALETEVRRRLP